MNGEKVISISACGGVTSMHQDFFNLGFLGPQRITRASDIRFDEDKQAWFIWLPDEECILPDGDHAQHFVPADSVGEFPTYNVARDFEVLWMNECLKAGVAALSDEGQRLGATLYHFTRD